MPSPAAGVLALLVAAIPAAAMAQPVALVLERSGASTPLLEPYREVPADARVTLPSGARLVFLHYAACRRVAVTGATVTFTRQAYAIEGGAVESESRAPCPRKVALRTPGQVGGVLMRSATPAARGLTLGTRPTFVVVGARADAFASARVAREEQTIVEAPLEGRQFRWPDGEPPLAAETAYELTLVPRQAGAPPASMRFLTLSQTGVDTLVLLSVD